MPQDAFTLRINALELNAALSGGRINRINQPSREELSFIIYTGTHTVKLVLNTNARDCGAYFTEDERENPLVAPGFCMLLRKHLQNAEILEVSTLGFERILCFKLLCTSDFSSCERILYAEIMGKYSNLILTEKGVVLGALKMTSLDENCKRAILAGVKYTQP
ncbi:MAG: NFACT family protein, partial [Clostridia bacterium]|nr:NFACT family protein [Clostridia bacterium]